MSEQWNDEWDVAPDDPGDILSEDEKKEIMHKLAELVKIASELRVTLDKEGRAPNQQEMMRMSFL